MKTQTGRTMDGTPIYLVTNTKGVLQLGVHRVMVQIMDVAVLADQRQMLRVSAIGESSFAPDMAMMLAQSDMMLEATPFGASSPMTFAITQATNMKETEMLLALTVPVSMVNPSAEGGPNRVMLEGPFGPHSLHPNRTQLPRRKSA